MHTTVHTYFAAFAKLALHIRTSTYNNRINLKYIKTYNYRFQDIQVPVPIGYDPIPTSLFYRNVGRIVGNTCTLQDSKISTK